MAKEVNLEDQVGGDQKKCQFGDHPNQHSNGTGPVVRNKRTSKNMSIINGKRPASKRRKERTPINLQVKITATGAFPLDSKLLRRIFTGIAILLTSILGLANFPGAQELLRHLLRLL